MHSAMLLNQQGRRSNGRKIMSNSIRHLNDADFKQVIDSTDKPVLVDFWADWCGPCKAIAPVLDSLADDLEGQVTIVKVNVDQNPETARELGIRSIPSLYVFKDGKKVAQRIGTASYNELKALVTQAF
jgi:thioredoxin